MVLISHWATLDVNVPIAGVGLSFATDDAEKIEGDGTDLTVNSGGKINLIITLMFTYQIVLG